jgi:hypothetical protein
MTCPLCRRRKGRRACPALGASICSLCCGTKRRVEIQCPADCVFLTGSHAQHWEGRETERRRDARRMGPHIAEMSEQQQLVFVRVMVALHRLAAEAPGMDDRIVLDVVSTLRKTQDTRSHGLIYDHEPDDVRIAPLVRTLGEWLRKPDDDHIAGPSHGDLAAALRAIEGITRDVLREAVGPSTEVLSLAGRIAAETEEASSAPEPSSPLITL